MARQQKRLKSGDVLRLSTPKGFAYLQYIGRHPEYGDAVLVSPRLSERVEAQTLSGGYVTFYPATAALAQHLIEIVDHSAAPKLPQRLRRPGARSGLRITTWIIEDGVTETVSARLSEDDLQLPIATIWNHELLIHRILEGWSPLNEGRAV
jgi:hypothetical protein